MLKLDYWCFDCKTIWDIGFRVELKLSVSLSLVMIGLKNTMAASQTTAEKKKKIQLSRICTDFPINEGFSLVTMTMTYQPNTREIIYNLMQSENMVIEC